MDIVDLDGVIHVYKPAALKLFIIGGDGRCCRILSGN
jgi:hypothetical protein